VQHAERADLRAEKMRVSGKGCEGFEGGSEEQRDEGLLMRADQASQLGREREDDVEVLHRQEQVALPSDPSGGGIASTLGTGSMPARMVEQVLSTARGAHRDVAAENRRAAMEDGLQCADMARQDRVAMALDVS
jgi:hypothetical protein